jgi:hypothetical protein
MTFSNLAPEMDGMQEQKMRRIMNSFSEHVQATLQTARCNLYQSSPTYEIMVHYDTINYDISSASTTSYRYSGKRCNGPVGRTLMGRTDHRWEHERMTIVM